MVYRAVGPPAVGEAFFNRERLLEKIMGQLKKGSILLVAPRRFGKTSIMFAVRDQLKEENVLALYLDVEWISEPSDFVTEIIYRLSEAKGKDFFDWVKGLPKGFLDSLKTYVDSFEVHGFRLKLRDELRDEWKEKGREILKMMKVFNQEIILLIDELPLMLYNMKNKKVKEDEIRDFLFWLRHLRIEGGIRVVVGGSIGIDHILKDVEAVASINDLERVFVGPFSREDAEQFIRAVFKNENIEMENDCLRKILEIIGEPIPYFIQILISALIDELRFSKQIKLTPETVEKVYMKRVLGVECRPYFEHYFQRLSIYYTPSEADTAKRLLKDLALKGEMSKKELFGLHSGITKKNDYELFNYLMNDLENDFYIKYDEAKGVYKFSTRVLRDLWLRRYEVLD